MNVFLIALVVMAVKLPLLWCCWYIYKAIHDVPEPEIEGRGGDFVRAEFDPGPRRRGPHGQVPAIGLTPRRGDKGHNDAAPKPHVTIDTGF